MDSEKHRQKISGRVSRLGILAATMGSLVPRLGTESPGVVDSNARMPSFIDVSPGRRAFGHSPYDWGTSPQCAKLRRQRKLARAGLGGDRR